MKVFKEIYLKKGPEPYFIAEIGINHNGNINLAKKMISLSKNAGVDAVKFQKRNFDDLLLDGIILPEPTGYLSKDEYDIPKEKKWFGTWVYPDKRLEFSDEEILELWKYADFNGLDFIVSPWERKSVDFLVKHKSKVIKVPSIEANNYLFCEYIADKGIPTIVSCGMTTYEQLYKVVDIFDSVGCPMMLLHCTSSYPSSIEDKNLYCISVMQKMFNMDIGFSGHGTGIEGTLAAVTLGANVIEKHVTLNKNMAGPDHAASMEFNQLKEMVEKSKNIIKALGNGRKYFLKSEEILHKVLTKKIIINCNLKVGEIITKDMLRTVVTKKEGGLLPNQYYNVVGKKTAKDLEKNHIITLEDFL